MLLALLLLAQNPVTVRLNHDQFTAGDHARVYVESAQDGYLLVLHADAEGRVRVLFPLDPSEDDFVRGGKKFELRGRGDRDAFQVEGNDGSGTVLAAVAPDAFKFDSFVRNDHWDFRALGGPSSTVQDDPFARLLDIVQQMSGDSTGRAGGGRFDYDYATYVVTSRGIASRYGYGSRYGLYPYRFGYYDPFCYDPFFFGWSASCSAFGYGFGFRGGYGLGFSFPIYRPYGPYRPYIFSSTPGRKFVIPNRPTRYTPVQVRPRTIVAPSSNRDRGIKSRPAPRPNSAGPSRAQPRISSGGRPSVSRGSGGFSRPASRPSSGGNRVGGGRRH
jgi:uncharacterized protein DUF4384